jgi:hypothetical protein
MYLIFNQQLVTKIPPNNSIELSTGYRFLLKLIMKQIRTLGVQKNRIT